MAEPRKPRARNGRQPEGSGNPKRTLATYATVRIVTSSETANFQNAEAKYGLCARVVIHTAHSLFLFQHGLLAVPPKRQDFGSALSSFLPLWGGSTQIGRL